MTVRALIAAAVAALLMTSTMAWAGPHDAVRAERLIKKGDHAGAIALIEEARTRAQPMGTLQTLQEQLDRARFEQAHAARTPEAYGGYLRTNPQGEHAERAHLLMCAVAWSAAHEAALEQRNALALDNFAERFPTCPELARAEALSHSLAPAAAVGLRKAAEELADSLTRSDLGSINVVVATPVDQKGCITALGRSLGELVTEQLSDRPPLVVLERSRLADVLAEVSIQLSDAHWGAPAIELGDLTKADAVVLGSLVDLDGVTAVNLRLVPISGGVALAQGRTRIRVDDAVRAMQQDRLRCRGDADVEVAPPPPPPKPPEFAFQRPAPQVRPRPRVGDIILSEAALRQCELSWAAALAVAAGQTGDVRAVEHFLMANPHCPQAAEARRWAGRGAAVERGTFREAVQQGLAELASGAERSLPGVRLRVVVADIVDHDDCRTRFGHAFAEALETSMIGTAPFEVLQRSGLDAVLEELEFQRSDLFDQATAVEVGRQMGATMVVVGSTSEVDSLLLVHLRLVSVEAGVAPVAASPELGLTEGYRRMLDDRLSCPAR